MNGPPPYGSLVLNELHMMFPALLYDRRRFQTVQDILEYIERQMSARYDLYSSWRNHFRETNPLPQRVPVVESPLNDPLTQLLLRAMLVPATTPAPLFWDPVPVAPTAQQIALASTVYTAPTRLETPCTICQDTLVEGDTVRKLNYCNHFFHKNCIDTWFMRHVDCPVCRHDIRGPVAPPQQTMN